MGEPFLEAVPPVRLLDWQSNTSSSMFPLSLFKGCINQNSLFLYLYSFETYPSEKSEFLGIIKLKQQDIVFSFTPKSFNAKLSGNIEPITDIKFVRDGGETLEGVYWGGTVIIPINTIKNSEPKFQVVPNYQIYSNFYKYQEGVLRCSVFPFEKTGVLLLNI